MSTNGSPDAGNDQAGHGASPLLRLRCDSCGYGASVRRTPDTCPMCGRSTWLVEGWRPWGDLVGDLDSAISRDSDSGVYPGVPLT